MKLYAVIHAVNSEQVMRNATIARSGGTDGIFLISHGPMDYNELTKAYYKVHETYPDWFIGINYLDLSNTQAIRDIPATSSALWCDNAWIDTSEADPTVFASIIREQCKRREDWKGLYFGGVAFKYQEQPKDQSDLARISRIAVPFVDVITTSGERTGNPPTVEKMRIIREAVGKHPVAIASGIDARNARQFEGLVDHVLVSTSISTNHENLDPKKVRELADTVHELMH
jgi:predicted TIM-barrel enzyme